MERLFSAITNPFNCHINAHWCPQVDTLRVSSISDNLISSITARFIKKEPVVANKFFCEGHLTSTRGLPLSISVMINIKNADGNRIVDAGSSKRLELKFPNALYSKKK